MQHTVTELAILVSALEGFLSERNLKPSTRKFIGAKLNDYRHQMIACKTPRRLVLCDFTHDLREAEMKRAAIYKAEGL